MRRSGRAVVLGATGLVGSALVKQLADDGWNVTATVRNGAAVVRIGDGLQGARVVTLTDVLDGDAVAHILGASHADVVVNCIATNPTSRRNDARAYANINAAAVAVVLDACTKARVKRAIVFGSGFEYAPAGHALDECSPIGPTTLYGATKAAGSVVAKYFRSGRQVDVCVARPFSVYGPRERSTLVLSLT